MEYINGEELPVVICDNEPQYFYAFTEDKSIMKEFIQTRNMGKFKLKVTHSDFDQLEEFIDNHNLIHLEHTRLHDLSLDDTIDVALTTFEMDAIHYGIPNFIYDQIIERDRYMEKTKFLLYKKEFIDAIFLLDFERILDICDDDTSFLRDMENEWSTFRIWVSIFKELFK